MPGLILEQNELSVLGVLILVVDGFYLAGVGFESFFQLHDVHRVGHLREPHE